MWSWLAQWHCAINQIQEGSQQSPSSQVNSITKWAGCVMYKEGVSHHSRCTSFVEFLKPFTFQRCRAGAHGSQVDWSSTRTASKSSGTRKQENSKSDQFSSSNTSLGQRWLAGNMTTPLCSWSLTPSHVFHSPCCRTARRTPLNTELLRNEDIRPLSLVTKSAVQPCLQALPSTAGASLENMVSHLVSCSACRPCVPSSKCIFLKSALKTTMPWLPAEDDGLCFTLQHPQLIQVFLATANW